MNASQLERAAYMAAHAIMSANTGAPELACPGARRSHTIDAIAKVIKDIFEIHSVALDEATDWWEREASPQAELLKRRRAASGVSSSMETGFRGDPPGEKILHFRAESAHTNP